MKLLIAIIATIISSTAIFAADFAYEPPHESDNALLVRIAELEAQLAALTAALSAPTHVDHASIQRQRQEAILLERFMFQAKYYGVCLTIAHNDLLTQQHALTKRQLQLENIRYELGLSTQNNINDITAALNNLANQIEANNQTIQSQRQLIETRRGREGYEFIGNFRIPARTAATIRNPQALRENLISNNTALYTLNSHINQAAWHGVSWQEIRLMEDQRDLLTRQLEITALTAWNNYQSARTAQALAHENRPLLQTRQTLVEEMYELGEISQIEKLQLTLAIQAEKFQADQAAISLALAIAEINFMSRGIA